MRWLDKNWYLVLIALAGMLTSFSLGCVVGMYLAWCTLFFEGG